MVGVGSRTALEALSKQAFGHEHRLKLARWILARDGEIFDETDALASALPRGTLYREIQGLCALGVLGRLEDQGRVRYVVRESTFWSWCRDLLDRVEIGEGHGRAI